MEISATKSGQVTSLELIGRLDANTSGPAQAKIAQFIDAGEMNLAFDLSRVEYISSAGLRVFMMAAKRVKAGGGKLVLHSAPPHIRELFDIAGLSEIFGLCASREEALARFTPQS